MSKTLAKITGGYQRRRREDTVGRGEGVGTRATSEDLWM